jgi:hypothetical protein
MQEPGPIAAALHAERASLNLQRFNGAPGGDVYGCFAEKSSIRTLAAEIKRLPIKAIPDKQASAPFPVSLSVDVVGHEPRSRFFCEGSPVRRVRGGRSVSKRRLGN